MISVASTQHRSLRDSKRIACGESARDRHMCRRVRMNYRFKLIDEQMWQSSSTTSSTTNVMNWRIARVAATMEDTTAVLDSGRLKHGTKARTFSSSLP